MLINSDLLYKEFVLCSQNKPYIALGTHSDINFKTIVLSILIYTAEELVRLFERAYLRNYRFDLNNSLSVG